MSRKKKDAPPKSVDEAIRAEFDIYQIAYELELQGDVCELELILGEMETGGIKPLDYLDKDDGRRLNSLFFKTIVFNRYYVVLLLKLRDKQLEIGRLTKVYDDEELFMELFGQFLEMQHKPTSDLICKHFWQLFRNPSASQEVGAENVPLVAT